MRSLLYAIARLIGDLNAIKRGTVKQRIQRRALGHIAGRIIGRIVK